MRKWVSRRRIPATNPSAKRTLPPYCVDRYTPRMISRRSSTENRRPAAAAAAARRRRRRTDWPAPEDRRFTSTCCTGDDVSAGHQSDVVVKKLAYLAHSLGRVGGGWVASPCSPPPGARTAPGRRRSSTRVGSRTRSSTSRRIPRDSRTSALTGSSSVPRCSSTARWWAAPTTRGAGGGARPTGFWKGCEGARRAGPDDAATRARRGSPVDADGRRDAHAQPPADAPPRRRRRRRRPSPR